MKAEDEDKLLRSVALQNAQSILLARRRAEQELMSAKEALEHKTAELAESLSLMRATLDATSNGILATDTYGKITSCNEQYVRLWALPREVLATNDHWNVLTFISRAFADPDAFIERVKQIYERGETEVFDVLELADGRVYERFSKIQMIGTREVGRVWSFSDVTQRRRAEEIARQAAEERSNLLESERAARAEAERASAMKDEFLATLSHELRTPLSAILGWAQVLRLRSMSEDELKKGLETIERNARVQAQLIEDLLDMSRITSGKLRLDIQTVEPMTFIEAAVNTVRPAAEAKGLRLETVLSPNAGPISGDPARLQQVVWNLLSNAIKFTARDGTVRVVLTRVGSDVEIGVSDSGIGIKQEFLTHVFDRFRQADASTTRMYGGLGLGLSIVKRLVELHGGSVEARSGGESLGATFIVRLPVAALHGRTLRPGILDRKAAEANAFDFEHADLTALRVLVVDDDPDTRGLIARVLGECNASVRTAANAAEALAAFDEQPPDVVISDIGMPDVDGYELLKRVRALSPAHGGRTPAIALTAFARSEDRTRALRAGFLVHVSKPVEPSELVATVASVAGRT